MVDAGKYRVHPLLDKKAKQKIKDFVRDLLKEDEVKEEIEKKD